MTLRRALLPMIAAVGLLAACSDGATTKPAPTTGAPAATTPPSTDAATTTTLSAADQAKAYTDAGPYPVGVTTLQLAKGPKVEVWYPAVAGSAGTESYDIRDYIPPAVKALLTANVQVGATYATTHDAAVADGAFPVVLFSHGFTGVRVQSTFLTANLAAWGMIVVAPEHPSRDLNGVLSRFLAGDTSPIDAHDSVDELLQSLDLIVADGADPTSRFHGHVDGTHVAAVGHSAGGGTALSAASDPRIAGYVSLASGVSVGRAAPAGSTTTSTSPVTMPSKPSLFIGGTNDGIVSLDAITRPAYEAAPSPSSLWAITGAGHNAFDDFCTFGSGTGIIGIADASGVGPLLDKVPTLRKLGDDGCKPPDVAVSTVFPIVRHAVTAWLRHLFGIDATAVGLGSDVGSQYGTPVTIAGK